MHTSNLAALVVASLVAMTCGIAEAAPARSLPPTIVQAVGSKITVICQAEVEPGTPLEVYELRINQSDDDWQSGRALLTRAAGKASRYTFTLDRYERFGKLQRDRVYSKFVVVAAPLGQARRAIMPARFVEKITGGGQRNLPQPRTRSKKGLQVQAVEDAIALGVQHAALNVMLPSLFVWGEDPNAFTYASDGQLYHFNPQTVMQLDQQIIPLSRAGMSVSLILLNPAGGGESESDKIMRHPSYSKDCPNHLSAFNTVTDDGVRHYRAVVEFLIDRYSQTDGRFGRVLNYIIGNEVNSHWFWSNMGLATLEEYTEDYLRSMRIACIAAERICPSVRVYMSLEHHWNVRFNEEKKSFPARAFMELFAARAREQGDFNWQVAFHPYPDNLFEPATWNDKGATGEVEKSPKITFKNIELLPEYMQRTEMLYRGQPRRIILSEQGFHTKDGEAGEQLQAAAYCYAFYKTARLDGIDAFILHRHVDYRDEGGLKLGLWTRNEAGTGPGDPGRKKIIYEIFRLADTGRWQEAFEFARPIIGIKSWEELLPPTTQPAETPAARPKTPRS